MPSKLDQLRSMTTVVADTGDIEAVRRLKPVDCTTNPSIVLKALGTPEFEDTMNEAVAWGARQGGEKEARVAAVADRLAVSVGAALAELVPGRVSTEVDADLSFDTAASIARAEADHPGLRRPPDQPRAHPRQARRHLGRHPSRRRAAADRASTAT